MSVRPVKHIIQSTPTLEGAGVKLRRAFGFGDTDRVRSVSALRRFPQRLSRATTSPGFPWHPHRGIETITYVLAGNVEHGDSLGNRGTLGSGDVQWMTAGSGIIHQEMPKGDAGGRMHGFQLWANLPVVAEDDRAALSGRRRRRTSPRSIDDDGTRVRIVCGEFWGSADRWKASPPTRAISTSRVPPGTRKTLPVETHAPRVRVRVRGLGHVP